MKYECATIEDCPLLSNGAVNPPGIVENGIF
jgi:hypothetical protein